MNEAADKYFVGNAQLLRKLETVETALWQNAKIVVPSDGDLVNIIGDLAGIAPVPVKAAAAQPDAAGSRSSSGAEPGGAPTSSSCAAS